MVTIVVTLAGVLASYWVYRSNIIGLVLSLPDCDEDFVFTGEHRTDGELAESTSLWPIPPKERGTDCRVRDSGDSPRPAT